MAVGFGSTSWYNPPRTQGFTPWKPPPPPVGSYDPSLDSAYGQAQRTYNYLGQDIGTANLRATQDYGLDRGDITRARDRGYEDLTTTKDRGIFDQTRSRDRSIFDLNTTETRGLEDYGTQTAALQRAYTQLGRRQTEGARNAGVVSGGLAALSAMKRAENQGIEQKAYDVSRDRLVADVNTGRTRVGEDFTTNTGRINEDFTRGYTRVGEDATSQLGRVDLAYNRGNTDRNTQLTRAGTDLTAFGLDTASARGFQATQNNWNPGTRPANQGVNAKGVPYIERTITGREGGKWIVRYDQKGNEMSRRRP